MRVFWLSPKTVGFAIPLLVGVALEVGGWVSHAISYTLFAVSAVWLVCALIYWRRRRENILTQEAIKTDLTEALEKLKATGRVEGISQGDIDVILLMSIELEGRHGYNDFTGLLADRASGVPLNELKTRPCSQCGVPRNQRGKHRE